MILNQRQPDWGRGHLALACRRIQGRAWVGMRGKAGQEPAPGAIRDHTKGLGFPISIGATGVSNGFGYCGHSGDDAEGRYLGSGMEEKERLDEYVRGKLGRI